MVTEDEEPLFTGYRGRILLSITGGSLFVSMVAMVIPPLLPAIIASLEISSAQAGFVMTIWWLLIAMFNPPGGRFADGLSYKTGLVVGLVTALIGIVVLMNSRGYLLLLLGVAIVGAGRGIYQPSGIGQISDLYVARRGQALGVRAAAFNFGGVVSGGLAAVVLAVATWQMAFIPILVGTVAVAISMHLWNRDPYVVDRVSLNLRETLLRLVRSKNISWVVVALSLFGFVWNGSVSFLPSFLQFGKGFSPTAASIAFSGVFIIGMIAQPLYGSIGDRRGHAAAAFGAVTLCAVGLVGFVVWDHLLLIAMSLAVFAVGLASFWPVMMAFGLERLTVETRAGDWGMITAIFISFEAIGSVYVGLAIDLTSYTAAFASLVLCLVATMAITFWLARFD